MNQSNLDKAKNLINSSNSIAVIPAGDFSVDTFSAGAGLYNLLLSQGKEAYFVYTEEIPEEVKDLIDEDKVVKNIKDRELVVSIDYFGTNASSAHYSTHNDVLEVRIGPIPKDFPKSGKVKAKLVGFDVDTVIFIGSKGKDTNKLYDFLEDTAIININNTDQGFQREGEINLIDISCENLSQQVFKLASLVGFIPNKSVSEALLRGISSKK